MRLRFVAAHVIASRSFHLIPVERQVFPLRVSIMVLPRSLPVNVIALRTYDSIGYRAPKMVTQSPQCQFHTSSIDEYSLQFLIKLHSFPVKNGLAEQVAHIMTSFSHYILRFKLHTDIHKEFTTGNNGSFCTGLIHLRETRRRVSWQEVYFPFSHRTYDHISRTLVYVET